MDGVKATILTDGIGNKLRLMLDRSNLASGFLNRYAYPRLIRMQRERWMTENDGQWEPLSEKYQKYKSKKFARFPGSGTKMLIATNQLFSAVTGEDQKYHRKIVKDNHLEIDIVVESSGTRGRQAKSAKERSEKVTGDADFVLPAFTYAGFVNANRNFTEITPAAIDDITKEWNKYVRTGEI